jgi:hypothetical protein
MLNNIIQLENSEEIISFLISPPIEGPLLRVKIVFIFFGLFFLGGTIYFLLTTSWLKRIFLQDLYEILTYKPYWRFGMKRKWRDIEERLKSGLESEYKLAVIEADSMLEKALKQAGFVGESLGERLEKVTQETLPNLSDVLEAHKIRNNLVHDPNYKLSLNEAKWTLIVFKKALRDLEIL